MGLRDPYESALECLDAAAINEVIAEIAQVEPDSAHILLALARDFQYERIQELLRHSCAAAH